ncbi:hypothetical protein HLB23_16535 [Nocardia uniformis]|uniref:Vanadium chloroperoxidase N-terminal domain-containing protein n=1 Tax=Nocardia uniformis TaxID=53432 RepID=A0A849C4U4_9NOCA|nr:hypothetical protein [Nocardia uniformis]
MSHGNGANEQTGPPLGARALAMVHLSMHDGFTGAHGPSAKYGPYLPDLPPAPPGASVAAAVAAAAYTALTSLFPSQTESFDQALADAELSGPASTMD